MPHAGPHISNQFGAISINHLCVRLARHARDISRELDSQNVRPLLQRLHGTPRVHQRVGSAMDNLHPGSAACISGVRVPHKVAPFLRSVLQTPGASLVGRERSSPLSTGEAAVRNTRVRSSRLKDLRVSAGEDVGHHAARGGAHDVDARSVGVILVDGVVHHGNDAKGVTAGSVRERGRVVNSPAVGHVGRAGVDEDEAVLIGIRGEACPRVPRRSGAAAGVELLSSCQHPSRTSGKEGKGSTHSYDDGRLRGQPVRHVGVHLDPGWVGAPVCHLLQRGAEARGCGEGEAKERFGQHDEERWRK